MAGDGHRLSDYGRDERDWRRVTDGDVAATLAASAAQRYEACRDAYAGLLGFTVDLRHPDGAVLEAMVAALFARLPEIAAGCGLDHRLIPVLDLPAVAFAPQLIACVEAGAERAGLAHRRIVSGAAHDAAYVARVAPTTMIFVPCLGGVSHNVAEFSSREECAGGTQVLLNAVLALDEILAGKA